MRGASPGPRPRSPSSRRGCPALPEHRRPPRLHGGESDPAPYNPPGLTPAPCTGITRREGAFPAAALAGRCGPAVSSHFGEGQPLFKHGFSGAADQAGLCIPAGIFTLQSFLRAGQGRRTGQDSARVPPPEPPNSGAALFACFWQTALEACSCFLFVCLLACCTFVSPVAAWGRCLCLAARGAERPRRLEPVPALAGAGPSLSRLGQQRGGGKGRSVLPEGANSAGHHK